MRALSEDGRRILADVAARHGVGADAVEHLFFALANGGGFQAQFNHPDLGGMGQWSQGGMIMIGDMFNNGLKAKVDWLCQELAGLIRSQDLYAPQSYQSQSQGGGVSLFVSGGSMSSGGWPQELGQPSSVGSQNNLRYAFFPASHRLAIDIAGQMTVYDTGDHQIGGFSQQQSGDQSLTFTSQYGLVRVADLPLAPIAGQSQTAQPAYEPAPPVLAPQEVAPIVAEPSYVATRVSPSPSEPAPGSSNTPVADEDDIFAKIEKLAVLHGKGILTDEEFSAKKADLLDRL
jgi:hypothetical protein